MFTISNSPFFGQKSYLPINDDLHRNNDTDIYTKNANNLTGNDAKEALENAFAIDAINPAAVACDIKIPLNLESNILTIANGITINNSVTTDADRVNIVNEANKALEDDREHDRGEFICNYIDNNDLKSNSFESLFSDEDGNDCFIGSKENDTVVGNRGKDLFVLDDRNQNLNVAKNREESDRTREKSKNIKRLPVTSNFVMNSSHSPLVFSLTQNLVPVEVSLISLSAEFIVVGGE